MKIEFDKIKLIIWDLDDTFWKGTLSEGTAQPTEYVPLIKALTERGIVNSICSKNDKQPVDKILHDLGIADFFVFNSIDWTPKGPRITQKIKDMGLRATNVLFIDDNPVNLNEAKFFSPELMIAEPAYIAELQAICEKTPISDAEHKRLKQYHILETKNIDRASFDDNVAFLKSSDICVTLHTDCMAVVDRLHELIQRTNQLNFTKQRLTMEELKRIIQDINIETGYVTVKDKFGDYGIVGFYAKQGDKLLHFLFSCRTIGQSIEQYVYAVLGYPQLTIVGDVANRVDASPAPCWINQHTTPKSTHSQDRVDYGKIVMKGPCDIRAITSYLNAKNIISEFTYVSKSRHNTIEHHNHSLNYLTMPFLSEEEKALYLQCVFNDEEMFHTAMYDADVRLLFLSTQIEPNLGIYRHKQTGHKIAFGEYCYPLTDSALWDAYVQGTIPVYGNHFTIEWLQTFAAEYEYCGRMTPDECIANFKQVLDKIASSAKLCLLLGVEMPYLKNTQKAYEGREIYYKELNDKLRQWASENPRVYLLDFAEWVTKQEDFAGNINHYQRHVYYQAAIKAQDIMRSVLGNVQQVRLRGKIQLWKDELRQKIKSTTLFHRLYVPYTRLIHRQ